MCIICGVRRGGGEGGGAGAKEEEGGGVLDRFSVCFVVNVCVCVCEHTVEFSKLCFLQFIQLEVHA